MTSAQYDGNDRFRGYAQGMLYELARELISGQIGGLSHRIAVEEGAPRPRALRISRLERMIVAFGRRREQLEPQDDAGVQWLLDRYGRKPGSIYLRTLVDDATRPD